MTPALWVAAQLVVVSVIYMGTAIAYGVDGRPGLSLAFVGYVLANVGFIWDSLR